MILDKCKMLFGEDIPISKYVTLHIPTVGEIITYNEDKYFSLVYKMTATAYQLMLFFYENDIDYTEVPDYEVFLLLCNDLKKEETYIFLGDLDLSTLILAQNKETEKKVLLNSSGEVVIDEAVYYQIVTYIREANKIKREFKIPGNEATRRVYIREAQADLEKRKRTQDQNTESVLINIISALCNQPGFKYNYQSVKDLTIYALFDAHARIHVFQNYDHLMTGIYMGTVDAKGINKKQLAWDGELSK